jgi:hypothetical protein
VGEQESTDLSLPKSAFRAILARLATLCNERVPDSVTPYGGEGQVLAGSNPPGVFRVAFKNTPDEQCLEMQYLCEKTSNTLTPSTPLVTPDSGRVTAPGSA